MVVEPTLVHSDPLEVHLPLFLQLPGHPLDGLVVDVVPLLQLFYLFCQSHILLTEFHVEVGQLFHLGGLIDCDYWCKLVMVLLLLVITFKLLFQSLYLGFQLRRLDHHLLIVMRDFSYFLVFIFELAFELGDLFILSTAII